MATRSRTHRIAPIALALCSCAVLLFSPSVEGRSRVCATSTLSEPFVLPGGFEHAPGKLTLCHHQKYSPREMLMLSYVDREPTGLLVGRRGEGESTTVKDPFMMFARDASGRLHLYGFAMPRHGGLDTFVLVPAPRAGRSPQVGRAHERRGGAALRSAALPETVDLVPAVAR